MNVQNTSRNCVRLTALLIVVLGLMQLASRSARADELSAASVVEHFNAGGKLSAEEVQPLEEKLRQNPLNLESRLRLIGYAFGKSLAEKRDTQLFGLIEHHPQCELIPEFTAKVKSPEAAEVLWLAAAKAQRKNVMVLGNAAKFVVFQSRVNTDGKAKQRGETAQGLLRQAAELDPKNPRWPDQFVEPSLLLWRIATAADEWIVPW